MPTSPALIPIFFSSESYVAVVVVITVVVYPYLLVALVFPASLSTLISYFPSSASAFAKAETILAFDEVASFCANKSVEATLNLVSVTFSNKERKEEKNDLILLSASFAVCTAFCSSVREVIFAFLSAVKDSTQEDVSKPDANPLNDIDILCLFFLCYYHATFLIPKSILEYRVNISLLYIVSITLVKSFVKSL